MLEGTKDVAVHVREAMAEASYPSAPLATPLCAHVLVPAEQHEYPSASRCPFAVEQPTGFAADLRSTGFALLRCPRQIAAPISGAMRSGVALLRTGEALEASAAASSRSSSCGLACSYKQQGDLKERLQVRRAAASTGEAEAPPPDAPASRLLVEALAAFEVVALACFEAWCAANGVPAGPALQAFGEAEFLAAPGCGTRAAGKSKAVLNAYHYFNEATCEEEPCREHADPGLLTLLCRSTNDALQVRLALEPGGAPGRPATYEECWRDVEPAMDACSASGAADSVGTSEAAEEEDQQELILLVAAGETIERLSAGAFPSCRHRVARTTGRRFNLAYELRPRMNVWHPWKHEVSEEAS